MFTFETNFFMEVLRISTARRTALVSPSPLNRCHYQYEKYQQILHQFACLSKLFYLCFSNQELPTTVSTKSGCAPRKLHFSSIFVSYMITNLPRTILDKVSDRLTSSFLIFITYSFDPSPVPVKNAISYLANIVGPPAAELC